ASGPGCGRSGSTSLRRSDPARTSGGGLDRRATIYGSKCAGGRQRLGSLRRGQVRRRAQASVVVMFTLLVLSLVDLAFRRRIGSVPPAGEQRGVFSGFFFPAEMARASNEIDLGVG